MSQRSEHEVQTDVTVSVVIVNYNAGDLLRAAVEAVLRSTVPVEVIVCDNGSTDHSLHAVEKLQGDHLRLRVVKNRKNLGFSRATKIGFGYASGEFILLLNPDCLVKHDTLRRMVAVLQTDPTVGMAGCLVRNPDGSEQAGCRRAVPTPWRSVVRVTGIKRLWPKHHRFQTYLLNQESLPDRPIEVEAISGAFMLVRRAAIEQVGWLDEEYFLHCEDLDWCMRFRRAGWPILFVPDVDVVHYKGTCSVGRPIFVSWHKHKGMIRFYRKFFRHQYPRPLMAFVVAAVWTRFGVLTIGELMGKVLRAGREAHSKDAVIKADVLPGPPENRRLEERRVFNSRRNYEGPERRLKGRATESIR